MDTTSLEGWVDSDLRNIVLGLASAGVAAIIAKIYELFYRRRDRARAFRKYPIEGEYASTYTDVLGGMTRVIRDQIHLRQRGLTFRGYSRNLTTGRQFNVEGRIVNDRYLAGTYSGDQRADESSGVFYMALDLLNAGYIRGLWAGYGAESKTVISGEWNWRKMAQVSIADCSPTDPLLPAAAALLNDALGSGYVEPDSLEALCASPEGIVLTALSPEGRLQGIGTAYVLDEREKDELEDKLLKAGVRRPNLIGSRVGILKSVAVVPNARGQGVGLRLVNERLTRLARIGCAKAVTLAWDSGSSQSSLGVLESAGFERVAELPEYWREPVGQETFDCIRCGRPCTCNAIVMSRGLYDISSVTKDRPPSDQLLGRRLRHRAAR